MTDATAQHMRVSGLDLATLAVVHDESALDDDDRLVLDGVRVPRRAATGLELAFEHGRSVGRRNDAKPREAELEDLAHGRRGAGTGSGKNASLTTRSTFAREPSTAG